MELLIVAAGKGSRMGEILVPKALIPVNGIPNLQNTIDTIGHLFTKITIAVSHSAITHFSNFITEQGWKNVYLLPIPSGLGSGHAVMTCLKHMIPNVKAKNASPIMFTWGDVHFTNCDLVSELLHEQKVYSHIKIQPSLIIPAVREENPYISISTTEELEAKGITFQDTKSGLHDQSLFLTLNPAQLYRQLHGMHCGIWNMDHYISDIKEFGFLQILSYMWNIGEPAKVYITENGLPTFNTQDELQSIEKRLQSSKDKI